MMLASVVWCMCVPDVFVSPPASAVLAGAVAGVAASLILCPAEDARIRMVAEPDYSQGGVVQTCVKLFKDEGLKAAYSGFGAMALKQIPYTVAKQCSFDFLAALLYSSVPPRGAPLVPLCSAALTSVVSCLASQPGDAMLTATYKVGV